MAGTEIFKCFSCHHEWEDYEDRYAAQMRKCSICLAPICLKCHADKTTRQHCFACAHPRGKNKKEVKQERKERYDRNKWIHDALKDLEPNAKSNAALGTESNSKSKTKSTPKPDTEPISMAPTGSINCSRINEACNPEVKITAIATSFNFMRINAGMLSNGVPLYFTYLN